MNGKIADLFLLSSELNENTSGLEVLHITYGNIGHPIVLDKKTLTKELLCTTVRNNIKYLASIASEQKVKITNSTNDVTLAGNFSIVTGEFDCFQDALDAFTETEPKVEQEPLAVAVTVYQKDAILFYSGYLAKDGVSVILDEIASKIDSFPTELLSELNGGFSIKTGSRYRYSSDFPNVGTLGKKEWLLNIGRMITKAINDNGGELV